LPIAPPPPDATAAAVIHDRAERAIVREINRVRRAHGLRTLTATRSLARIAHQHSVAMLRRNVVAHLSIGGRSLTMRVRAVGKHKRYGETLAFLPKGSGGARRLVRLWMSSPVHRRVLTDPRLRRVGVGRVYGMMGSRRGHAITADFTS